MTSKKIQKDISFKVRPEILICLFLTISILSVYWQVRNYSFLNYDDPRYVTENHHVRAGLTLDGIIWSFTAVHSSNWHPITWLSHMLDCQIYGLNPGQHHMTNVLFHILNTLLLFFVLKRMTGELWQSGFVAGLFAMHPLHVESVAWVAERKDVLSTFFWMLTMWSYVRYVERARFGRYLLVLMFFILGLMTKPMLITLPFVLLLLDYWPLNRFQIKESEFGNESKQKRLPFILIFEKIPLFLLSAISSITTYLIQKSSGAVNAMGLIPLKIRISNAIISYTSYIGKMIWPHNLAVLYPYPKIISLWKTSVAALILVVISIIVLRTKKTKPYFAVGWFWYVGTLVPVIGFVQVGMQAMADRYTYIPLIGMFIIIAWGGHDLISKWRYKKIGVALITALILTILMVITRLQVGYWSNSIALFEHALAVTSDNSVAHLNLGEALAKQGKINAAIRNYYEAMRIRPDNIAPLLNFGIVLRKMGKFNEAINYFSKVLRLKSDCAEAHFEMGLTFKEKGDFVDAITYFLEALHIKPDYAKAHNSLGLVLMDQDKDKDAAFHFYEAIKLDPSYFDAYLNLGKFFTRQGKVKEATLNYRKALHLNPNMPEPIYHLAWILATYKDEEFRNGEEAVRLATRLCRITQYNQPLALDALAAAYAETNRFNAAISTAENAFKLASEQGMEELALGLRERLELYKAGRPCR